MNEVNAKRDFFRREMTTVVNLAAPGNKQMTHKILKSMDLKMAVVHAITAVEMLRLAFRIKDRLEEFGLYSYNRKKHCNVLVGACREQSEMIRKNENTALYDMYTIGFPYYRKDFRDEGYDVFKILHNLWVKECEDPIERIYQKYDAALQGSNIKNHFIVAELYTILALIRILRTVFGKIEAVVKKAENNFNDAPLYKYSVLDKIQVSAVNILRDIPREDVCVSEEVKVEISEICTKVVGHLLDNKYADYVTDTIQGLTYDYVEFCLAKILIEDRQGGVNEFVEQEMRSILGGSLYEEIVGTLKTVNIEEDFDIIDVMTAIPDAHKGEPLYLGRTALLSRYPYTENNEPIHKEQYGTE